MPEEHLQEVIAEAGRRRRFVPITVQEDLNWTELSRIAVNAPDLPGVSLDAGLLRDYPMGAIMAHVLGYVGPVSETELNGDPLLELPDFRIGKNGIEKVYDGVLRGRAGISRFEVNALGREIKELYRSDGEPGRDLSLTIDLDLQRYVYERLSERAERRGRGPRRRDRRRAGARLGADLRSARVHQRPDPGHLA